MYLPAFARIGAEFQNVSAPQYSLASYFVGLGIGQVTAGAISDRLGRRAPLMAGMAIYLVASLGCAAAWNTDSLVVFRFLAALGASAGIVIPRAQVRDLADGHAAAQMFSKLMLAMGVAPIVAPLFGALCIGTLGSWRWIFVFAALYGVVALMVVALCLPDTLPPARRTRIGVAAVAVRYGAILRERAFLTHACLGGCTAGCLFGYLNATPQIFIGLYGWSPAGFAALFGVNSLAYIGYNQLNPWFVGRFGIAPVITATCTVMVAACVGLAVLAWHPVGPFGIVAGLLIAETGFGFITPCAMIGAMSRHQAHAGSASALHGTFTYTAGAFASLGVGAFADGSARPMAVVMLGFALLAALAAAARPRLIFASPSPSPERAS
jgi:DHA1 family bicyclomycin/chloramphenicol resistance-like MFS transporter